MSSKLLASFLVVVLTGVVQAQMDARPMPPKDAKPHASAGPDKEKPEFPPFDEAMKDYEEVPTAESPFFPLWYNKKTDSLRAQIPSNLIGQQFLIATSMAGGPVATGFQIDHFLAYFDRMDKNLVLMRVDPRYVEGEGDQPLSDVIKRSYGGDDILKSISILTMKGSDPIIDLDSLFKGDFSGIGRWGMGQVNPQLSKWSKYKTFPQNVELTADLALMSDGSGRRTLFHYSLSKIPESSKGYKPRLADDRVGYFMTVRKDWTKEHNAKTLFDRYINRWKLEKRDPSAKLSAPKEPIKWYIEKTVPLKYRRWVKEGILEWNKAYEKCGFLDAVEVKQQEDYDPETKDLDPEDVRYNFFRWIVTGRGFAMGPSRDHPLTGQIFDADIVFDDAMVRFYEMDYANMTGNDEAWRAYEPIAEDFFRTHPEWSYKSPFQNLLPNVRLRNDPEAEFRANLMKHMQRRGRPICECAAGMAHQMQFAGIALEGQGLGRSNEDFMGQVIKEVVMHEVGHCLGLRHNFKASTWLPMEEIEAHSEAGEANVGSVMDYNPSIVVARDQKQGSFTTRSIGPYDYWAIEYGYRPVGEPYKSEEDLLRKVASRVAEAGLDYSTDEDTMWVISPDPLSNRFDMGRDVKKFADFQIGVADSLLKDISEWAVKDGESYNRLRRAFGRLLFERGSVCEYVARFVGGVIVNRDHRGDEDGRTPLKVVDAKTQRESLEFCCKNVFAEDAFQISPKLLALLAPGRHWHWDSDEFSLRVEFNIHDFVAQSQFGVLFNLMNPFTIGRIHDNQLKFQEDDDVYTLAGHMTSLSDSIWSELQKKTRKGTDEKPMISSFRRNLQRMHAGMLINLILSEPGAIVPADANAIARLCAKRLSERIAKSLESGDADLATEAHLSDVKKQLDKVLDAQYSIGVFSGGGGLFFLGRTTDGAKPVTILPSR